MAIRYLLTFFFDLAVCQGDAAVGPIEEVLDIPHPQRPSLMPWIMMRLPGDAERIGQRQVVEIRVRKMRALWYTLLRILVG